MKNRHFESLKDQKFTPISQQQMYLTKGGQETGANRALIMEKSNNVWTDAGYVHVVQRYYRSWTSDSINGDESCYWGESYYWL